MRLSWMLTLAALAACGDKGGDTAGSDGAAGADPTVVEGDGASVSIPEGALADGVEVAIALAEAPVEPEGFAWAGEVYAFTPHGTTFAEPVTISIPVDGAANGELVVLKLDDAEDTTWEPVTGATFADGVATFHSGSFSYYGAAASAASGTDADGDGYDASVDCADNDPATYPGAPETCDGLDEDCDGTVDNDPVDGVKWCADADADGYGDHATATLSCERPSGYVDECTDCDDADASVGGGC